MRHWMARCELLPSTLPITMSPMACAHSQNPKHLQECAPRGCENVHQTKHWDANLQVDSLLPVILPWQGTVT